MSLPFPTYFSSLQLKVCAAVGSGVNRVVACTRLTISCGSIIINATIEVEDDITEPQSENSAPRTVEEFTSQASRILNYTDSDIGE